ncbi:MAG: hypothetical protein EOR99_03730 [Mesorhizobium sp.]|nr:MAG: hypothetical protein EOR99_03730 [Mesorhizobium sp.]
MTVANDNKGDRSVYVIGPDPEGDLCNHRRVADAAKQIHAEISEALANGSPFLSGALEKGTAYHNGLTNIETQIAIVQALALMQIEITRRISEMNMGSDDDDDCGGAA